MTSLGTIDERRGYVLAGARIFIGFLFIVTWVDNLRKGLYWTDGYAGFIQGYADKTTTPLMPDFLEKVVIPNAALFSKAQLVAELVIFGVFLLVGFLTPVSGLLGAGFGLNLLLASWGTGEWWGVYGLLVVVLLVVGLTQSGRTLGVDAYLVRRDPHPRLPLY